MIAGTGQHLYCVTSRVTHVAVSCTLTSDTKTTPFERLSGTNVMGLFIMTGE